MLSLPLLKKTAVLTQELLSLTPRRVYFQPPVHQHQEIGSQVADERVSGCGIHLHCWVPFQSPIPVRSEIAGPFNDKP